MIHEIRTYDLLPNSTPEFLVEIGEMIEKRTAYSPLIGFFHTEVGPLNGVVHIWQYEDMAQRDEIRQKVIDDGIWPPNTARFVGPQWSEICIPAPFVPEFELKRDIGPLFELRSYTYASGDIPKVIEAWGPNIEARMSLSQPVGIWYTETGDLNRWIHMWAYKSYEHRTEARKKFASIGWPPKSGVSPLKMENMLLHAADFSPVQ